MNFIWRNGRFAWPFVLAIAGVALALYAFDLAWRVLTLPFAELALVFAAGVLAVVALALVITRWGGGK